MGRSLNELPLFDPQRAFHERGGGRSAEHGTASGGSEMGPSGAPANFEVSLPLVETGAQGGDARDHEVIAACHH